MSLDLQMLFNRVWTKGVRRNELEPAHLCFYRALYRSQDDFFYFQVADFSRVSGSVLYVRVNSLFIAPDVRCHVIVNTFINCPIFSVQQLQFAN